MKIKKKEYEMQNTPVRLSAVVGRGGKCKMQNAKCKMPTGFSLIELVFAMLFLIIIIFGVINLQSSNLAIMNSQKNETQAHFFANQGIQIAKAIGYTAIKTNCPSNTCNLILSGSDYSVTNEGGNPEEIDGLFKRSFTWRTEDSLSGAIEITMNINWEDSTGEHSISAKQIIY